MRGKRNTVTRPTKTRQKKSKEFADTTPRKQNKTKEFVNATPVEHQNRLSNSMENDLSDTAVSDSDELSEQKKEACFDQSANQDSSNTREQALVSDGNSGVIGDSVTIPS